MRNAPSKSATLSLHAVATMGNFAEEPQKADRPASVEDAIRKHYQDRADEALLNFVEARQRGEPPERVQLLREAYERLWRLASYVRRDPA